MNIVYRKTGIKRKISDVQICINNHLFGFEKKTITMYLKAKNSLHTIQISSFKYISIVFFEKNDAKI